MLYSMVILEDMRVLGGTVVDKVEKLLINAIGEGRSLSYNDNTESIPLRSL